MNKIILNQKCVYNRNGSIIWLKEEEADKLQKVLNGLTNHLFVTIPSTGETINTADLSGIFNPKTIEEVLRRKRGQWQCEYGSWHSKNETTCECGRRLTAKQQDEDWEKNYGGNK